jgi:hypothetical protein
MNTIIKFTYFFFGLFIVQNSIAQIPDSLQKKHLDILSYASELNLSNAQVEQIKVIQKEYQPKIKALRSEGNRTEIKKLQEEKLNKLKQVLTTEQLDKWKEIKKSERSLEKNAELKKALEEYHKLNILPVLKEKRKAFENELSNDEKLVIAEQRAKIDALKAGKGKWTKEEIKQRRKALKSEIYVALRPIIENHKGSFEKLKEALKTDQIQWKKDLEAIRLQYGSEGKHKGIKSAQKDKAIRFLLMRVED